MTDKASPLVRLRSKKKVIAGMVLSTCTSETPLLSAQMMIKFSAILTRLLHQVVLWHSDVTSVALVKCVAESTSLVVDYILVECFQLNKNT